MPMIVHATIDKTLSCIGRRLREFSAFSPQPLRFPGNTVTAHENGLTWAAHHSQYFPPKSGSMRSFRGSSFFPNGDTVFALVISDNPAVNH